MLRIVTSNKLYSGLTGLCFESPNDTIHATVSKLRIVKKKSWFLVYEI